VKDKKLIAWGAGPMLEIYLRNAPDHQIAYCIDSSPDLQGKFALDVPIVLPDVLEKEDRDDILVIITAMSSASIQAIHAALSDQGFILGKHYIDLSAFLKNSFKAKAESVLNRQISDENYVFARSFNLNSQTPLETTILGNWLLLETLQATCKLNGAIAEVGAYKCGNSHLLMSAMNLWKDNRKYYIFDSFEGFAELSDHDPSEQQKAYNDDYKANRIFNSLKLFEQAVVVPGFVPHTFSKIPDDQRFSMVFYDCDLYQPALDTYAFFWDRIEKGGMLVIHDNIATAHGWTGVRKATEEYFSPKGIQSFDMWETTMSVIFK